MFFVTLVDLPLGSEADERPAVGRLDSNIGFRVSGYLFHKIVNTRS